jgi:2'-5' RNA ligase
MLKRTFIALDIPISQHLKGIIEDFRKRVTGLNVKWVDVQNFHLTLAFLGDTEPGKIEQVKQHLGETLKSYRQFPLTLKNIDAFRSLSHPQVVWIGITASRELESLYRGIQKLAGNLGFETDNRPYKPHLTLGRVKSTTAGHNLREMAVATGPEFEETITADTIYYYESILSPEGPTYIPLQVYRVG